MNLPPGVGPHEDCELELMVAGVKPLALFSDVLGHCDHFPEDDFAPHVAAGRIVRREALYDSGEHTIRCVFYALPGQEWRIDAAHALKGALYSCGSADNVIDDVVMGWLLGYRAQDIRVFIGHQDSFRSIQKLLGAVGAERSGDASMEGAADRTAEPR